MRPSHRKHNPMWPLRRHMLHGKPSTVSAMMILKDCYPQRRIGGGGPSLERPRWAKLARDRHWITSEQYYAIPVELVETLVGSAEWKREQRMQKLFGGFGMYTKSPFFGLLRKDPL